MKIGEVVYDGNDIIGFWLSNNESGEDEFVSLEEIGAADISQLTKLEQGLYLTLGSDRYSDLEELADRYKANPQEIILAFVHDLIISDSSGGSDERDAASAWFRRNCIGGEFVR